MFCTISRRTLAATPAPWNQMNAGGQFKAIWMAFADSSSQLDVWVFRPPCASLMRIC